jgi:phosphoadenosine phosphosulfate reductase
MVLTDLILKAGCHRHLLARNRPPAQGNAGHAGQGEAHYGYDIAVYRRSRSGRSLRAQNGLNAFYDSVEMRKECCRIRKVEPLGRALAGNKAWVTGQRRAQSATRAAAGGRRRRRTA